MHSIDAPSNSVHYQLFAAANIASSQLASFP